MSIKNKLLAQAKSKVKEFTVMSAASHYAEINPKQVWEKSKSKGSDFLYQCDILGLPFLYHFHAGIKRY